MASLKHTGCFHISGVMRDGCTFHYEERGRVVVFFQCVCEHKRKMGEGGGIYV